MKKHPLSKKTMIQHIFNSTSGISDNTPHREMWEEIAKQFGGRFTIKQTLSHVIEIHNIKIPHNKWIIEIAVSDTRPLRFKASFSSIVDFELTISRVDFFDRLLRSFGRPDFKLGWRNFDQHYLIKSNHPDLVKKILTTDIQKAILQHNIHSIAFRSDLKNETSGIYSVIQRNAGTKDEMIEMILMFKLLIDNLEESKTIR